MGRTPWIPAPRHAVALVLLLGTLFLLGGAGTASAHAALRDIDPRDGSILKSAPKYVTLTFTESVSLSDGSIRILSPDNHRVSTGEVVRAAGRSDTARVRLRGDLPDGTFTVGWRVVSADSHPISGAFTFSIGKPSATSANIANEPTVDPAVDALYDIARYAAYSAVALLVGAATFLLVCRPPTAEPLRKLLRVGWWTLLLSTVALLFLRGPYARGTGPTTVFDLSLLQNTLAGRPGWALLARLVLTGVAAVFLVRLDGRRGGDRYRWEEHPKPSVLASGAILAIALAGTWAAAEHASAGIQVPVAVVSSVLHLLAMAVWLGGLVALLATFHRRVETPLAAASAARFSRLAFVSVTVLVATGVYQSWRGLGSWDALFNTSYGRLLNAKMCAFMLLLGAAMYSRRWTAGLVGAESPAVEVREVEPVGVSAGGAGACAGSGAGAAAAGEPTEPDGPYGPDKADGPGEFDGPDKADGPDEFDGPDKCDEPDEAAAPHRTLRRSVLAEVLVGVVVLVITTLLTGTEPGRAVTETRAAAASYRAPATKTLIPYDTGSPTGRGKIQIFLEPSSVGENAVEAVTIAPDGSLIAVPEVRLTFTLASQKIGPIDAELTDKGGYWGTDSVNLPLPGTWTMKVTVRTSEIDQVTESSPVEIAP